MKESKSELGLSCFLSALSFGASFEELANFLIDQIDVNVETARRTAMELSSFSAKCPFGLVPAQAQVAGKASDYIDVVEARLKGALPESRPVSVKTYLGAGTT